MPPLFIWIAPHNNLRTGWPSLFRKSPGASVVSRTSSFTDEEWNGFKAAAPNTNVVAVQIADARDRIKLFRPGRYPVVRGTALIVNNTQAYLWTSGYTPRLDTYVGPETPNSVF